MVRMIGAMPALAVRQQRRHVHHDDLNKSRPSTLTIDTHLAHTGLATPLRSPRATPHTSPVHSINMSPKFSSKSQAKPVKEQKTNPKKQYRGKQKSLKETWLNCHLFGCISLLHISVLSLLLGIIILVVGLVQLAPGANFKLNEYVFIGCGLGLLSFGFTILILLCICQKKPSGVKENKKKQVVAKKKTGKLKSNLKCSVKGNQNGVETVEGVMATFNGSKIPKTVVMHPGVVQHPITDYKVINEVNTADVNSSHKPERPK